MATIYDIDYQQVVINLLPGKKRVAKMYAWLVALITPLQWLHDNFFNEYANGSTAAFWSTLTNYPKGSRVVDPVNNAVYEAIVTVPSGGVPPSIVNDETTWGIVAENWIGLYERIKYTSQKITLEYALNKVFRTTWLQPNSETAPSRPDIYIDNNNINNLAFISAATEDISSSAYSADQFEQNFVVDTYSFSGAWFTIMVPLAVYNALNPSADSKIRAVADKYVIAGITYEITTY